MSCKKENHNHNELNKSLHYSIKASKNDVVERFLSVLWKREVDLKLTLK